MNRYWIRRITFTAVTVCVVLYCLRALRFRADELQDAARTSGYVLCSAIVFLAIFNVRKRLAFIPLGSASVWMQLHIYTAIGAICVFFAHTGVRWPNGIFETALYVAFVTTSISGIFGLYLTRSIPKRLTKLREQIIYERIPVLRRRVQLAAHQVVLELLKRSATEAIADLYLSRLVQYFGQPRSPLYYVVPASKLRNELQGELAGLTRFLSNDERAAQQQLRTLIDRRDDLDYQEAQQRQLKLWLFVHIGLTVILLALMFVHVAMAHAFSGRLT